MKEMEIRLYNNYLWLEYMLSWMSHQWWQLPLPRLFMDKQAADDRLLRLKIFTKVDAIAIPAGAVTKHQRPVPVPVPVLVRVMAPEAGLAKEKRAPVDLVAVLDASPGAREVKEKTKRRMEQLIEAMRLVTEKLSHKDRLAIVPVQSSVTVAVPGHTAGFLEMSTQGRSQAATKVQSLVDLVVNNSSTASANKSAQTKHRREQPKKAMELVRKWLHIPTSASPESRSKASTTAQSVAANGSTGLWNALMDAVKMLNAREETAKDSTGFIIVISNSDDDSILQQTLDPEYVIHAFSFHNSDTRNTRVMHYIASNSSGIYGSLHDKRNQITEAFTACINKITSVISVQTVVDIKCSLSSSIALSAIESGKFCSAINGVHRKSGSISLGALHAGTVKNFMLYVDNVREEDHKNLSKLLTVHVEWLHAFSGVKEQLDGQVVIVRNGSDESKEVMVDIMRAEVGKIITEITDPSYHMSADKLKKCLEASDKARAAGDARLTREMEKMKATLHRRTEQYFLGKTKTVDPSYVKKVVADKLSYMLSWLSFQALCEQTPSVP